jgi:peptide/nickel transport system permease protein
MERAFVTLMGWLPLAPLLVRGGWPWLVGQRGLDGAIAAWTALACPALWWQLRRAGGLALLCRRVRDPFARVGLYLVLGLHLVALLAPLLATHPPAAQDLLGARYLSPSPAHWMGTDGLGRDLYSRVVYGARVSLAIALASVLCNVVLGVLVGATAGYAGGMVDGLLMRATDLLLAFPRLFLILAIVAVMSPTVPLIVLVLGTTGWMGVARLVRGGVLATRGLDHVEAARALGVPGARILLRHILPMASAPVIPAAALRIGSTILVESFLSFLGLGVQDPAVSWGMLIRGGRTTPLTHWWVSTFPGLAIMITVIAYNLLGDGLRDAYDPRLRLLRERAVEGGDAAPVSGGPVPQAPQPATRGQP